MMFSCRGVDIRNGRCASSSASSETGNERAPDLRFHITYLDGGDRYFGPDLHITINTLTRKDFAAECGNLGRRFSQMRFRAADEDAVMSDVADHKVEAPRATETYLRGRPDLLAAWLDGVTTRDGSDGLAAVGAAPGTPGPR